MNAARLFVSEMAEYISMPDVYVAIRTLLLDSKATIDDVVEVLESDSMLSVRVMRMAQSRYFGFHRRCETLHQAISLIGLMQLHDLLLGSLCLRTFSAIPEEVLDLRTFWRCNVQCGIAARTIAQLSNVNGHHVFFTLGLLHEIGHASMFLKKPDACRRALRDSESHFSTLAEAERKHLGFDYGEVGAEIMKLWHLPPVYQQVAACHLEPARAEEDFATAVNIVHLAHEFCQDPRAGRHRSLIRKSVAHIPQFSRLPANIGDILVEEINTHTDAVLTLLWPCGAQDLMPQPVAQQLA